MRTACDRYNRFTMSTSRPIAGPVGLAAAVALVCIADAARGCAVCMGSADSTEQQGVNAALLTMLGLLSVVFVVMSFFVARLALHAHAAADASEAAIQ